MNIEVITSFNAAYYQNIGRACVSSWLEHWPKHMILTCYVEQCQLENHVRICQIPFSQLGSQYENYQLKDIHSQEKKFAKKAYSVVHAMQNSRADWIVWLDSDVISVKNITQNILDYLTPENKVASCLGVWYDSDKKGNQGRYFVPETGIFAINRRHALYSQVAQRYQNHYDAYNWQGLRRRLDNDALGSALLPHMNHVHDMCSELTKPYKTPLAHTVLGPYLQHYKAKHSKVDVDINFAQWSTQVALVQ